MSGSTDVDSYTPGHGDASYDVTRYDLELTYKVEGNLLNGVARLTCVALADIDRFTLDLHGLRVRKVGVDGTVVKYTHRRDSLTVRLGGTIGEGQEFEVVVQYAGHPAPLSSRSLGTAGWEELADGAIVAGQPHGAPSWFPCNDRPANKASYRIVLSAPNAYRVVCNGELTSATRHASTTTWVYEQPEPMATYLATVQIGRYQQLELDAAVPMHAALPGSLVPQYDAAFGRQPEMMEPVHPALRRLPVRPLHRRRDRGRPRDPARVAVALDLRRQLPDHRLGLRAAHRPRDVAPVVRQQPDARRVARHLAARGVRLLRRVVVVGGVRQGVRPRARRRALGAACPLRTRTCCSRTPARS